MLKWLHILSSTVLFGTGVGSAFYLLVTALSAGMRTVAHVARWVVRVDWLFTATTALVQPLTGLWLVRLLGIPLQTGWVAWSLALYGVAMACWLAVVWLQLRMRDLAQEAAQQGGGTPCAFRVLFIAWVVLGVPVFLAFVASFWLMVAKPSP